MTPLALLAALTAYAGFSLLALFILWVAFIAVMAMKQTRDAGRLPPDIAPVVKAVYLAGLGWDVFCNLACCWLLFWECPRELTISARLQRLVMSDGRRGRLARWFAVNALNPFCPRDKPHIKL